MLSSKKEFCNSIDTFAAKRPINVLVISAHGKSEEFILKDSPNEVSKIDTTDSFPIDSCLNNLAPGATVILDSCSTGNNDELTLNIANHIHNNAPRGTKVIAPRFPPFYLDVLSLNPLEAGFRTHIDANGFYVAKPKVFDEVQTEDITYRIDPKVFVNGTNLNWACRHTRAISYLNICQNNRLTLTEMNKILHEERVSYECIQIAILAAPRHLKGKPLTKHIVETIHT